MPADTLPIVGITMGDPAGIGPELCLQALSEPSIAAACVPAVIGDGAVLTTVAARCGLPPPRRIIPAGDWIPGRGGDAPVVVDCRLVEPDAVAPGQVQSLCGRAAFAYIEEAVRRAMAREISAIATAPINKEALKAAGVAFPGHTEILAALTGSSRVCMMLASEHLIVSMVTTHIGFAQVPHRLSIERVLEVIELTAQTVEILRERKPRLAVCGLNPHAGEHGLFGNREEENQIEPAIRTARERGIDVEGPIPPDTVFVPSKRHDFDAIVTMYHDQGHIPFKMLAFDTGVNITLGLPIVRVSVDHGTAFDIAWKGLASPESLYQAIRWAARLGSGSRR